jgi:meso-butanediol dehydrogenase/(S,S)-butanediol dehydrogenase/diacetyl reductase
MAMRPDLSGQAIFVTGAGRGLGRSMAAKLAECGARLALVDMDEDACRSAAQALRTGGAQAWHYAVDVSRRADLLAAAADFARDAGRIDAVINNAMLLRYEPLEQITEDVLARMTGVGINGTLWGCQALLAHYDPARGGAIINMASPVAERGYPNTAAYSLVKGAIVTLTKVLAAELGPRNVRVNAISPASVPTPGALGLNDPAEYERRKRTIPLRRLGSEQDNADACAFLLSPEASFINGEILHVDGGVSAAG